MSSAVYASTGDFLSLRCTNNAIFDGLTIIGRFSQTQINALSNRVPTGALVYNTTTSTVSA
jgi:hypothetical protein